MAKDRRHQVAVAPKREQGGVERQVSLNAVQQAALQLPVRPNSDLIRKIEEIRASRVLSFVLESPIDDSCLGPLYEQLKAIGKIPRIDLFLQSRGGKTELPWRIVSLIREFCDHFGVLVPYQAHSAATHIAIGADEIVMTPRSELSPVDPTRTHPLLPGQRDPQTGQEGPPIPTSVQDLKHCVTFVAEELGRMRGSDAVTDCLTDVVCALFERVHPLAIGAIEQSYRLGRLITRKVLLTHLDPEKDKEKITRIENQLSDDYRSHHYPICRQEVRDDLGLNVTFAPEPLETGMEELLQYYVSMFNAQYQVQADVPLLPIKNVGFIDTTVQRRARRAALEVLSPGAANVIASWWVTPPERT